MWKYASIITAALLVASPLQAGQHDAPKSPSPTEEELQKLGEIAQGWMKQFADRMSPMVEQLKEMVDDLNVYEAPEMLPNGDIIIRRKPKPETTEDGEPSIEL